MRKRWMAGLVATTALAVAGGVAMLANTSFGARPKVFPAMQAGQKEATTKRWRASAEAQKVDDRLPPPLPEPVTPIVGQPSDAPTPMASPAATEDPMGAVDAFLQRNMKEADDSIKALSQEAETLRARLEKVEAALARWQLVAGSLGEVSNPSQPGPAQQLGTIEGPKATPPPTAPSADPRATPYDPPLGAAQPSGPTAPPLPANPPAEAASPPVIPR